MSERQDKKRRYNQRLAFIAAFTQWLIMNRLGGGLYLEQDG